MHRCFQKDCALDESDQSGGIRQDKDSRRKAERRESVETEEYAPGTGRVVEMEESNQDRAKVFDMMVEELVPGAPWKKED